MQKKARCNLKMVLFIKYGLSEFIGINKINQNTLLYYNMYRVFKALTFLVLNRDLLKYNNVGSIRYQIKINFTNLI